MPEIVHLASEANRRWMIEDRAWNGAIILGPAVAIPFENVQITNSNFDVAPDILFFELPVDRPVVGFIGLRNVTFTDCQFQGVGFAAPAEVIANFRESMGSGVAMPHARGVSAPVEPVVEPEASASPVA